MAPERANAIVGDLIESPRASTYFGFWTTCMRIAATAAVQRMVTAFPWRANMLHTLRFALQSNRARFAVVGSVVIGGLLANVLAGTRYKSDVLLGVKWETADASADHPGSSEWLTPHAADLAAAVHDHLSDAVLQRIVVEFDLFPDLRRDGHTESAVRQFKTRTISVDIMRNMPDMMRVSAYDSSPHRAQQIANRLGEVFERDAEKAARVLSRVVPVSLQVTKPNTANPRFTMLRAAFLPARPVSPNRFRLSLAGGLLGFVVGLGGVFIWARARTPR
jgi:hypothetical protein